MYLRSSQLIALFGLTGFSSCTLVGFPDYDKNTVFDYATDFVDSEVSSPRFIRPPEIAGFDCTAFVAQDKEIRKKRHWHLKRYAQSRIVFKDPPDSADLLMDCQSIFARTYFQREHLYAEERNFPIAYARVLFRDYMLVEKELGATYAPQNFYCYVIDAKSSPLFHRRINALTQCFPNVFVINRTLEMDSHGKNMGYAHYKCMLALGKPKLEWKYLLLLQNHELALKTNQEMIQIFKWYNGTNDIKAVKAWPEKNLLANGNWSFEALKLFKNSTRNQQKHNGYEPTLRFTKSTTHVAVSRKMVDFMLNDLDLSLLMKRIEDSGAIVDGRQMYKDELLLGTLNADDAIEVPGGYTHHCVEKGVETGGLTALVYWWAKGRTCRSGVIRHNICMLAMENLEQLVTSKYLFANKFMPSVDYGAIACWHEWIFNRTHLDRGTHRLKSQVYLDMRQVRFNREKHSRHSFDPAKFNCN